MARSLLTQGTIRISLISASQAGIRFRLASGADKLKVHKVSLDDTFSWQWIRDFLRPF
jgi:hypothetical protein